MTAPKPPEPVKCARCHEIPEVVEASDGEFSIWCPGACWHGPWLKSKRAAILAWNRLMSRPKEGG